VIIQVVIEIYILKGGGDGRDYSHRNMCKIPGWSVCVLPATGTVGH
jgi:hypothetical protein